MTEETPVVVVQDEPQEDFRNKSGMHPGVVNGRRVFPLKNTSKPHKGKGKLAKKMKRLNNRRLDHSDTLRKVAANQQHAYRTPGSMNPGK